MMERFSDNDTSRRDIPSFIEPRPPLIQNPFMRPRPQKGTNLLELFEDSESEIDEPELVQVYLRMKPCNTPNNLYEVRSDKCLVTSLDTTTAGHGRRTQHNVSRMYTFSRIFDDRSSQKEIFEQVVKENLKKLPHGHSFTLLTYGASGSGKTYTLMGNVNSPGLVPRSLEYVFKLVDAAQQPLYKPSDSGADKLGYAQQDFELKWVNKLRHISAPQRDKYRRMSAQLRNDLTVSTFDLTNRIKHYVWVSFVEIYNEAIYDLLSPPDKRIKLRMREDTSGQVYVKGVTQAFVKTGEEAYDVMVAGKHNLVVAATGIHANSSRSHCIFTITMLTETDGEIRTSCIRLCDLAGCERARATRNTGARMQESRAINSSLHVLERCLHLLRRNQKQRQEAIVPYRESKLTRLLGSGLSGSRGEAVSMVVTLNPSPQYSNESKHVLSLAAVAQDIQINNTAMYASATLESSAEDSTIDNTAEIMKLRADNERLHFELVQAQSRNRELLAEMEDKQKQSANTMEELVQDTKDMTRLYYESQIDALKINMEEIVDEYEAKLKAAVPPVISAETPTRFLQTKVAHLMKEITVLQDKLSAEQLARARAEKEVQHLNTCIDERDEKADSLSEKEEEINDISDSDDEVDPLNESLEPSFRKERLNKSQAAKTKTQIEYQNDTKCTEIIEDDEMKLDKSTDLKSELNDSSKNSEYETGDESEIIEIARDSGANFTDKTDMTDVIRSTNHTLDASYPESNIDDESKTVEDNKCVRETYFVSNVETNNVEMVDEFVGQTMDVSYDEIEIAEKQENPRGTYFVRTSAVDSSIDEVMEEMEVKEISTTPVVKDIFAKPKERVFSNFDSERKPSQVSETKMTQEKAIESERKPKKISETLVNRILKSLKSQSNNSDSSLRQFEQLEMASEKCNDAVDGKNMFGDLKILKEKRTYFDDSKGGKLHEQNAKLDVEEFISCNKTKGFQESIDEKENDPPSRKSRNTDKSIDYEENKPSPGEILISNPHIKRTYFDNIIVTDNKIITDIKSRKHEERSPSIVKDDNDKHCEPSTMKILLGDNLAKNDVINNNNPLKKHDSIDVFESPLNVKAKDREIETVTPTNIRSLSNLDEVRESIKKLVLEQKTRTSKQEIKTDSNSSTEEEPPMTVKKTCSTILEKEDKVVNTVSIEGVKDAIDVKTLINEAQASKRDNTIDEFEIIYKNVSIERPTQFDLLVTEDISKLNASDNQTVQSENEIHADINNKQEVPLKNKMEEVKYNLRHRGKPTLNVSEDKTLEIGKNDREVEEILAESSAKCESKAKSTKKSLRLRRRKNQDESHSDQDDKVLKDILNLKKEFSDVTMGLPAFKKDAKDIPSPEKSSGEEFLPPPLGILSCPSKSVTRSRRKLFTPRAEPLEESMSETGDSNERVRVPRPSYHRARVRRKL